MSPLKRSSTRKLNTKVFFYQYKPSNGPEPGNDEEKILYKTRAEIYDPSMKDLEILNGLDSKLAVTLVMRDPIKKYIPDNKDFAEIIDYRYSGLRWNIVEVRHDLASNEFVTLLLAVINDE